MTVPPDPRARRVAVVADSCFEERLAELGEAGFGVMQLPPADLDEATASDWVELTAEQVAEYQRTGYDVVLVDDGLWGDRLDVALAALGAAPLRRQSLSTPSSRRRRAG